MTSQINPNNIDGTYPVAGQPNNTQGFRDNFTNIKTNFSYAQTEITNLQNSGVFKAALPGTTLDNNMNNNLIYAVNLQDVSYTYLQQTITAGAVAIDFSAAQYQSVSPNGNVTLSFTNWPAVGTAGMIYIDFVVTNTAYTVTLPSAVSLGTTGIQGLVANVLTFGATGTFKFAFSSVDAGTTITIYDLNRPLNYYTNGINITATTASANTTSGALIVAGGAGIGGNVNVGGNIKSSGLISSVGNIITGANGFIGVGIATPDTEVTILANPQTVSYPVIGNSTTTGTDLHITGADGANTRITQDSFGTGSYVAFTGRTGRGTAASPSQTQSGDTLAQFTARGFSSGNLQFGNISTGRVDVVAAENFTDTSRATNVQIFTTATGAITPTSVATFSSANGLSVVGNVAGGNVLTAGIMSSTANITGGNLLTGGLVSATGNATILAGTAVPTGGTTGAGYKFSSTTNLGVFFGAGAPTLSAAQGSLYLNTTGNSTSTRMYVNTNSTTGWTAVTTAT